MFYTCPIDTCRRMIETPDESTEVPYCRGVDLKEHAPTAMRPADTAHNDAVVVLFVCTDGHSTVIREGDTARCATCGLTPPAGAIRVGVDPAGGGRDA